MHSGVLSVPHKSVWQAGESFDVHFGGQRKREKESIMIFVIFVVAEA